MIALPAWDLGWVTGPNDLTHVDQGMTGNLAVPVGYDSRALDYVREGSRKSTAGFWLAIGPRVGHAGPHA